MKQRPQPAAHGGRSQGAKTYTETGRQRSSPHCGTTRTYTGRSSATTSTFTGGLESGNLFFGAVGLWVITPPCWDHCAVNKQRAGDSGEAGSPIGDADRLITAIQRRHTLRGLMWEDVPSVADFESFRKLTALLAEPALGLASTWAFVDVWRLGSPSRRKRVAVVAIAMSALRNADLETPLPGDDRVTTTQQPPNAAPMLLPPHAVPGELRIDAKFYEQLSPEHARSSPPSIQVGRIAGRKINSYVYDPNAGPVATIQASVFKAEGPGGNTGLAIDSIGPRLLAPEEVARIHGFEWSRLSHLEPHMIHHIIGNSVTVHMARAFLDYFDRNLDWCQPCWRQRKAISPNRNGPCRPRTASTTRNVPPWRLTTRQIHLQHTTHDDSATNTRHAAR